MQAVLHQPTTSAPQGAGVAGVSAGAAITSVVLNLPTLGESELYPRRLFVRGDSYRWWGLFENDLHMLGAEYPGVWFLLGTYNTGKDMLLARASGGRHRYRSGAGCSGGCGKGARVGRGNGGGPREPALHRAASGADAGEPLLRVTDLKKHFPVNRGLLRRTVGWVRAVDGITFSVAAGETVGLVGESGCGKSTTGRTILRLLDATSGEMLFRSDDSYVDLAAVLDRQAMKRVRRRMQIIFQDPFSSLDPRMTVRDIVDEPMRAQKMGAAAVRHERVERLLELVGLNAWQKNRYPHEFSGGQRQRIGIARALAVGPSLLVCDEPVSALDVSVQAQILNLLEDLQTDLGLTYLFIAHDLSVVEHIADRVLVMYLGKIVEVARADDLYRHPRHPYTEALLKAIPASHPQVEHKREPLQGNVPDPANPPTGCNFHPRCPYATDLCTREEPDLQPLDNSGQMAACHHAADLTLAGYHYIRSTS